MSGPAAGRERSAPDRPPPGLVASARRCAAEVARLRFGPDVAYVYAPLEYAWPLTRRYLERFARRGVDTLLLGMNPGPFGMAQTGVPFGEVGAVRDWLGLEGRVGRPAREHPRRPVEGLACARSEVSGRRLWGWARERFGTPERFFRSFFVWNYCPLAFLEGSGRNLTPDRLPARLREPLLARCDRGLVEFCRRLVPARVVGVGAFAARSARRALAPLGIEVGQALHPSPANPTANRGWRERFEADLRASGARLPPP